jgi:superfamily II DNA or RNA helicase
MDPVDDLLRRWLVEDPTARAMLGSGAPQPMRVHVEPGTLPVGVSFYDGSRVTLAPHGPTATAPRPRLELGCTCEAAKAGTCKHQFGAVRYMLARLRDAGDPPLWAGPWADVVTPVTATSTQARLAALLDDLSVDKSKGAILEWVVRWDTQEGGLPKVTPMARYVNRSGQHGQSKRVPEAELPSLLAASPERIDRRIGDYLAIDAAARPDDRHRSSVLTALLPMLVGHPHVRLEEDTEPLAVEALAPRLVLLEDGRTLRLRVESHGAALKIPGGTTRSGPRLVAVLDRDQRRLVVGHASPELARTVAAIERERPFDRAFAPAVLETLAKRALPLPLELPPSLAPHEAPCDERLRVAFTQEAGAWTVALVVRPLGGSFVVAPGQGSARPFAAVGGVWSFTTRDLASESRRAALLADDLHLPLEAPDWMSRLDLAETLALSERLQGLEGVLVEWPEKPPRLLAGPAQLRVTLAKRTEWFDVEGAAEIDGTVVSLAALLAARRARQRFVEVEAGSFVDLARLFDERLERLAAATRDEKGHQRLSRGAALDAHRLFEGFEGVKGGGAWLELTKRSAALDALAIDPPKDLVADLRDYQLAGFRWLARLAELGLGGVLADDMGLGKTVQAIAMLLRRAAGGPAIVVAPTSVIFNWQRELARFAPSLTVVPYRDGDRARTLKAAKAGTVLLTTWALLRRDAEAFAGRRWHTVVYDEAHAMKNAKTATAKAARAVESDWTVALTGTPIENHMGELYSLMETVLPGLFGSWDHFARTFATPIENHRDKDAQARLTRLVRPFLLRRTKAEVAVELPPRTEVRLDVELSEPERKLYDAECARALGLLPKGVNEAEGRIQVLAALTRVRQLACATHLLDDRQPRVSSKIATLLDEVREVHAEGRAMLVFSQFTSLLALVSEALAAEGIAHGSLTGETPSDERRRLVDDFQGGRFRVFLLSLKAGGSGLNLTAADTVFLLDPWWNPAAEDQAADRAHRLGQTQPVTVVRLVALGTVEEKVLELHTKKRELVRGVLEGADISAKVSVKELVELLRA